MSLECKRAIYSSNSYLGLSSDLRHSGLDFEHWPQTLPSIFKRVNPNSFEIAMLLAGHIYPLKKNHGKTKTKKTATESPLKFLAIRIGISLLLPWTVHSGQPLVSPHHTPCGAKWWSNIRTKFQRFSPEGKGLVNKSATFSCVLIYSVLHSSWAHPSFTKW